MTYLLVAVDKFTKWIEAKPIKKLDGPTAVKFFKSIIYRFGYPNSIITDNGSNFVKGEFARWWRRSPEVEVEEEVAGVEEEVTRG